MQITVHAHAGEQGRLYGSVTSADVAEELSRAVGRKAAAARGFDYSSALKASGLIWTAAKLDVFLTNPGKAVPGTAMPIRVSDATQRESFVIVLGVVFALLFLGLSLLQHTRWARRWIAMADSPAASATIGVNLLWAKVAVFALSGAIAGFAGAMYGLQQSALRVDSFPLFLGLPLVLLLAVQGVRFPVAAFMGAIGLASFPALQQIFKNHGLLNDLFGSGWLTSVALIGPGIAAITMAFRPDGAVFYAGRDLAALLPWRHDARDEKELFVARQREQDIGRDEIGELGLIRPFTEDNVAQLDRRLRIADELAGHALVSNNGVHEEVLRAPVVS